MHACFLAALLSLTSVASGDSYLVLLDRAADPSFRAAAEVLAARHRAAIEPFGAEDLESVTSVVRAAAPRHLAIVVDPRTLDLDFAQRMLVALKDVDDDPFVDVAFAYVTGRDGAAAERLARKPDALRARATRRAHLFGSWEGPVLPPSAPLTALKALGFTGGSSFVLAADEAPKRTAAARAALAEMRGADALLFFSHGYPDRMEHCLAAGDLAEASTQLDAGVLINCACWNGVTGRWWMEGPQGAVEQAPVAAGNSIALALLDADIGAYVAGLDPWHGPLAMRYAFHLADEGCTIAEAAKETFDRLVLDFAPQPLVLEAPADRSARREGVANRRRNAASIVVFGDPAWAPLERGATHRISARRVTPAAGGQSIRLSVLPLIKGGAPGVDFMVPQGRLIDYHSVRTEDWAAETRLEIYRSIPWDASWGVPELTVRSARVGSRDLQLGAIQVLLEQSPLGDRLHVRVPIDERAFGSNVVLEMVQSGAQVELDVQAGESTSGVSAE